MAPLARRILIGRRSGNHVVINDRAVSMIHAWIDKPNLYVKIPGTPAGLSAIEESLYAGVPVNGTLLFSRAQSRAAAEA